MLRFSTAVSEVTQKKDQSTRQGQGVTQKPFEQVLSETEKRGSVTFSKHAASRLNEREIELSREDIEKLSNAVEAADIKGIKDSLILMNNKAFIVNVPSNVVVTVMDSRDISEQKVFTNLDGAVII